jgi:hypothetical protein
MTTITDACTTLMTDPVAQELLRSPIPARFAYTWHNGTASVTVETEPFPEWLLTAQRYVDEDAGHDFLALVQQTFPAWARIAVRPDEVRILDFGVGKFPSAWSAGPHP